MASKMDLVKLCLIWLFLQDKSILTHSRIIVYTVEGSAITLPFLNATLLVITVYLNGKKIYSDGFGSVKTKKHDVVLHTDFQMKNVTQSDTGYYWLGFPSKTPHKTYIYGSPWLYYILDFTETINTSCSSSEIDHKCVIAGSSPTLTFVFDWPVYHSIDLVNPFRRSSRIVADLQFINQTDLMTIIGQEGKDLDINCISAANKIITSLQLKLNGSIIAIGDNQSVSYSFTPDRTDHLTKYQCEDSTHSSIMIAVTLVIRYAPSVIGRYTNETIECACDGVPAVYSVYRFDQHSEDGKLIRSVNLNNQIFTFNKQRFPYMINGIYTCVVSNGIPDISGTVLQTSSINVKYEGPPVFAEEDRYVKIGKVRQSSVTISFHVYSFPDVEEIFLEKLGRLRGKKRKIDEYVLKPTLLYNAFDKTTRVPGYAILIESDELYIDNLQPYCITVTNRLGASEYYFAITKKENNEINQNERAYVFTICILGVVLFSSIIVYVCVCVRRVNRGVIIHSNMNEDHTYHTYDEIGTISYGAVSNVRPSETHDNQGQILAHQHEAHISNEVNVQSPDSNSTELNTDFSNEDLQQLGVAGVQEQPMSLSTDDTDSIDNKEHTRDRKSQTSNDSDSESSQTVMVGNVGDGYENPYQTVLLDRPEGHQYTQITIERNTSVSSAESNCEMQILEKSLTKEGGYINLQF
ncbi:unnamed protein product [Mytilus edulis]|uniref:Ig-like domain-containing protein n=1 Tax=Mytilus edulis TaxID=6550 RepID=A0A8S3SXI8_MYTED|nr:unnamed protein product [Mytilus edulis]